MALSPSDIQRALDNTQPYSKFSELGLFHFWRKGWPEVFDNPFAKLHYRITKSILEMYHPKYTSRHERQVGIVIHRESGKSTLDSFAWPLTCIWLKGAQFWVRYDAPGWEGSDLHDYDIIQLPPLDENFILIASETATRSENFVTDIKVDLESRPDLDGLFGPKKPVYLKLDEEDITSKQMWRQNAFTTSNGVTVWGIGAGQQTRGIKVRNRRPSLTIVDDMYSRKNTKTDTIRENLNYWYFAELENSADTQRGKTLWVGTIVHNETVPTKLLESDLYKTTRIPIIEIWELEKALKHVKRDGKKCIIPDRESCLKLQEDFTTMSWKERHNLHSILTMYKKAYENHDLSYFYQEYLNISVAPEEMKFTWEQFVPVEMKKDRFEGRDVLTFEYQGRKWLTEPIWYYGIDLASSDSVKADEAGIARVALLNCISDADNKGKRRRIILPYIDAIVHGRGWNVFADENRKGIATELIRLATDKPGKWYEVDAHATQQLIVRQIDKAVKDAGLPGTVNEHRHIGDKKSDFILSVLEPIVQKYDVFAFNPKYRDSVHKLFQQLSEIGKKSKDDIADMNAMAFLHAKPNKDIQSQFSSSESSGGASRRRAVGGRPSLNALELWEVS